MRVNGDMPINMLMDDEAYEESEELTHWGIKGMRWGIRRYQNKDGSLTPAGKKKLKAEGEKLKEQERVLKNRKSTKAKFDRLDAKRKALEDEKRELDGAEQKPQKGKLFGKNKTEKPAKKTVKDMSDAELVDAINRKRLEDTYAQLHPKVEKHPMMNKLKDEVLVPAAVNSGKKFLESALTKAGEKLLKDKVKVDPNSIEALTKVRDELKLKNEIENFKKGYGGKAVDDVKWANLKQKLDYEKTVADLKKSADEAARAAYEPRSRAEYERTGGTYSKTFSTSGSKKSGGVSVGEIIDGSPRSTKTSAAGKKKVDVIIDVYDYEDVTPSSIKSSPTTETGRSYIAGLLPAPGLPSPRDDD